MAPGKLSAAIITYNEEDNIGNCLSSLQKVADEIIVVDSFSTDKTEEICLRYDVSFIKNPFKGHIEQKNFAAEQASHDFVLSLDADEELSEELANSIIKLKSDFTADAYELNRRNSYCGQWIYHCGWYPDKKVRIWNKKKGKWGGENPHDKIELDKGVEVKNLNGDLLHYSYKTISSHIIQIEKFTSISAQEVTKKGKRVNVLTHMILYPFYTFLSKYFIKQGFREGYYGFIISVLSAYGKFLKYAKAYDLYRRKKGKS